MLIGIGTDITDISRIERLLGLFGERFMRRVFTEGERARARRPAGANPASAAALARRFAAKEACAKALGTGIGKDAGWKDIEVENLPSGQPRLVLHGRARQKLHSLLPPGAQAKIDISLSDDYPKALAFVVISAVPATSF